MEADKDWIYLHEAISFITPEGTALICSNSGKVLVRPDDVTGKMVSDDNAMQGIHAGDIAIHGMDTWHGAIAAI